MSRQSIHTMMRVPTLNAIYAAELKVAQSRLQTYDALQRGRNAFRVALARPASVVTVAAAATFFGYLLARRFRPKSVSIANRASASNARMVPAAGLIMAFILRYAKRQLPAIFRQVLAAQQDRAAHRFTQL